MKKHFKGFMGLKYVEVRNVPVVKSGLDQAVPALALEQLERQVAEALLEHQVPIRGAEVQFIRESFGLSQKDFGKFLGLSGVAILKWEKTSSKRLDLVNEIAVRALIAQKLELPYAAAELFQEEKVSKIVIDFEHPKNGKWLFDHLRTEYPALRATG
jgi:DNA-binding transcriptional regulator YiaG